MASYGRNFDFRVPPKSGQRSGRFLLGGSTAVPIGAPVVYDDGVDASAFGTGVQGVLLATTAQDPTKGLCGVLVYEALDVAGNDPSLTAYSDIDTAPAGKLVQVVSGDEVKVAFKNTEDRTFLNTRDYDGRVMVAGLGATPTVVVGDWLTPGTGNDTDGYWAETATESQAWLVVTAVDSAKGEVEARMLF